VHAAGVVISPKPIHELIPVCTGQNDELITQFVMTDLEKTGMLKMDFLALTTLTIIEDCLRTIERETGERPDLEHIPLNDPKTLKLFTDGNLQAIFQFESCLSGETQVGGKGQTIRELYEEVKSLKAAGKFNASGVNRRLRLKSCYVDDGEFHFNYVVDVVATGVKRVYRLITKDSHTIKATADHHFLTQRGWVRLGDLDLKQDKLLFKTDSYYGQRVCQDCRTPLKTLYRRSTRCKSCASRLTSNPSKPEAREKISYANWGRQPWNYKLDPSSPAYAQWQDAVMRGQERNRGKSLEELHGVERAAELRANASKQFSGKGNPMYGRSQQGAMAYSVAGVREDLGHYVRSTWEADFARVLKYCGLPYEYELHRLTLVRADGSTLTYAPDFYVPSLNCWYEIKGWMDQKSEEKIRLFTEQYPNERLVVIDRTRFAELQMQYQDLVEWECPKTPSDTSFLAIESIKYEGEEETYDIKMRPPGNNFLANGFVVHNSGMVEICRKLKPEGLEDLSALNALYRPGPLDGGMVDDYIERRHGRRKVTYIAPQMKDTLENTLGIIIYQEQIMQLAQRLAGYSLGEADLMRRAMGKKKKEEMAVHEEKFIMGAVERGIATDKAEKIFSLMAQFADYGFNRSHSFAYAYLAYQTAYLKAHFPTNFYAAVLSNELANTAKVARYIGEMKVFGIELLPPDVNSSKEGFTPVANSIRFGLAAIKGIGSSVVQLILHAREEGGPFKSVFDFAERVDQKAVNKRVLESLVKAGAFDTVSPNRAALMAVLDRAAEHGARAQRDRASGQSGLFAMLGDASVTVSDEPSLPNVPAWSKKESLAREKEALGLYASGHPLEDYADSIKALTQIDSENIAEATHGDIVAMGGIVIDLNVRTTKKGDRFALFRIEDQYGSVKVVCWPEQFNRYKSLIQDDEVLLVRGKLELSADGDATIISQDIQHLDGARSSAARGVLIRMDGQSVNTERIVALCDLLSKRPGRAEVFIEIGIGRGLTARLRPQQFLRVTVSSDLLQEIEALGSGWKAEMMIGE
ncbi:MAG: DNA polymerase III subunit alpha, partial [Blastocatellia bacterium]